VAEEPVVLPLLIDDADDVEEMLEKMRAVATGVTTKGSSTLMRQKVGARRPRSSR